MTISEARKSIEAVTSAPFCIAFETWGNLDLSKPRWFIYGSNLPLGVHGIHEGRTLDEAVAELLKDLAPKRDEAEVERIEVAARESIAP